MFGFGSYGGSYGGFGDDRISYGGFADKSGAATRREAEATAKFARVRRGVRGGRRRLPRVPRLRHSQDLPDRALLELLLKGLQEDSRSVTEAEAVRNG